MLGILLQMTGFNASAAVQTQTAMTCVHVSFTFIPAFFALIALFMMIRYPITRAKHSEIIEQLNR